MRRGIVGLIAIVASGCGPEAVPGDGRSLADWSCGPTDGGELGVKVPIEGDIDCGTSWPFDGLRIVIWHDDPVREYDFGTLYVDGEQFPLEGLAEVTDARPRDRGDVRSRDGGRRGVRRRVRGARVSAAVS
jgi:hypothetical protein